MGSPVIVLSGLHKTYHLGEVTVEALRNVSLSIDRGEFIAVMGASGSGKSTLMNILGCLDRPTSGTYRLDGEDVGSLGRDALAAIRRRKIGFVFQGFNLLSRMTALENVELPMIYEDVASGVRMERAREALRSVGLLDREHHLPSQMSGGQQQRVAIARAVVNAPSLLLADEPTGNLDSATSGDIMGIFRELSDVRGITLVLVTHEPDLARYANRMVRFRDGRIISDEPVNKA
ncbi:MAG: ABC transporter ATP-binding protein [Deltaproteobacteria bacterium]|nr:ABC transporter ATP-binding protein [Deltaproteobacteria bacterium]